METTDTLYADSICLVQAANGYRFSLDPVLLADFVTLGDCRKGLDLGCGCGVLALLLARRSPQLQFCGWERQVQLAQRAQRSCELSGLEGRVTVRQADLREHRELTPAGAFDLVVTNPPYRATGNGQVAPNDERAAARHELAGGLEDFLAAAGWCLRHGGRFAIVYLAERLAELLAGMAAAGIAPKRLRLVHPRAGQPARMVMVEGRKGGAAGLVVGPPLYIYRGEGDGRDYTDEVLRIYGEKE